MAGLMMVNPRKRRTKRKSPARRRVSSITRTSTRRYRRNPIGGKANNVVTTLKDGAIGAVGAVATEVILSKLPLPTDLTSGRSGVIVKALAGVGTGMLVAKFAKNRALGKAVANGAVTVAVHDTLRSLVAAPAGLNGYGGGLMGMDDTLLGEDFDDLGYYGAAETGERPSGMDYYGEDDLDY